MLKLQNKRDQEIVDRVYRAGQEHVFRWWDDLTDRGKTNLLAQLAGIDLRQLQELYQEHTAKSSSGQAVRLEPAEVIPTPRTKEQEEAAAEARRVGETALRDGKVAVLVVAGGQATRLGIDAPKGTFPIGPITKKSLFQLHAEKILATSRKFNVTLPWYVMTSETNYDDTVAFFEQSDFFGLSSQDVFFFKQGMIAALDLSGKLILDAKDHVFTSPNGHGGSILALKQSGVLEEMIRRGIEEIFYFQVDNPLVRMADPVFLGHHINAEAQISSKVTLKVNPEEKVGVIGRIDGRLGVIEYSELSDEQMHECNADGSLKFSAGNIAIHALKVSFVEALNEGGFSLPYHAALKAVPFLDERGTLINPEEKNGVKFETFIFDALGKAERSITMEVVREEEFAPVKNATGEDSPETAQCALMNLYGSWLEAADIRVARDVYGDVQGLIEVSPLYALDREEFLQRVEPDLRFDGVLNL